MKFFEEIENKNNKSLEERVVFEVNVQYEPSEATTLSGLSNNLSIGGLYLKTKLPLTIDSKLMLSFSLPYQGQEVAISCLARVAWTNFDMHRLKPDYPSGVGLQFLNLSQEDLSLLSKFIETYDETKRMNVVCAWCGNFLGLRKGPFGKTSHGLCSKCRETLDASVESA